VRTYSTPITYFIPSNFGRSFARDPRTYSNPDTFDPTRFLGGNPEQDPRVYVYGFGRRICPGRFFAEESVFITCAIALAALNIEKAVDDAGKEIIPAVDFEGGGIT
jgi:cytochrome P450